ncbi:MAG: hypothetical protein IKL03_02375 [Bacteroidaceae bacterium]|nr:hypothetical protein [Bacteroidaceae bacterium]
MSQIRFSLKKGKKNICPQKGLKCTRNTKRRRARSKKYKSNIDRKNIEMLYNQGIRYMQEKKELKKGEKTQMPESKHL